MCLACELSQQPAVQNPSTIMMVIGYVTSIGMLMFSYAMIFSKRFASFFKKKAVKHIQKIHGYMQKSRKYEQ